VGAERPTAEGYGGRLARLCLHGLAWCGVGGAGRALTRGRQEGLSGDPPGRGVGPFVWFTLRMRGPSALTRIFVGRAGVYSQSLCGRKLEVVLIEGYRLLCWGLWGVAMGASRWDGGGGHLDCNVSAVAGSRGRDWWGSERLDHKSMREHAYRGDMGSRVDRDGGRRVGA
jgi:hypothetical protein